MFRLDMFNELQDASTNFMKRDYKSTCVSFVDKLTPPFLEFRLIYYAHGLHIKMKIKRRTYDGLAKYPRSYDGSVQCPRNYDGLVQYSRSYYGLLQCPGSYYGLVQCHRSYGGLV